jgi:RNA polymerase sigma factor (sigma-70 family)
MEALAVGRPVLSADVVVDDQVLMDAAGWTEFYRAEYPRLARALHLYCGDADLGSELAQEAMAKAWRCWPQVRGYVSPAGWAHRVGINLANSAWRRAVIRHRLPSEPSVDIAVPADDVGTAVAVRAAVAGLPRRQRTALVLRYFVDLPVDEVAALMGCRPGTVAALTAQAIASLRQTAGLHDVEEGGR